MRDRARRLARRALLVCALSPLAAHAVGLAFGTYDLLATSPLTSSVTVRLTCTLLASDPSIFVVAAELAVSPGLSGNYTQRRMANGPERMSYNLYTTNSYATVWGNGTGGTGVRTTAFLLNRGNPTRLRDITGYGRVPALQDVGAGDYADNLVVSVDF